MMLPRFPSRPTGFTPLEPSRPSAAEAVPLLRQGGSLTGFTVVEVLIAVFIMASLTVAITSLAILGTRTAGESERHTVALGLINQHVERIRILAYTQIGYTSPQPGEPDGVLERTVVDNQNQQPYTLTTTITLIDDPLNGTISPLTEVTADYKKIQVTAAWQARGGVARDVTVVTYVAVGAVPNVPSPFPTTSPTPTLTPTPTFTISPSPTLTPTPTFTIPPTPTLTPTPTFTISPSPTPTCRPPGMSCSGNSMCCSIFCSPVGFCQ